MIGMNGIKVKMYTGTEICSMRRVYSVTRGRLNYIVFEIKIVI